MDSFKIVAFYLFTPIENPENEVKRHRDFLKELDVRCRIYIASDGINAQMSFRGEDAELYMDWLKGDERFANVFFKVDPYDEHVLPKVTVKVRKQLAALDQSVNVTEGAEHISPQRWREMLEERDDNTILIDARNDYESVIGHFEGAELPPLKTFREFLPFVKELSERVDPKKAKVMMYCTGGIRCELYTPLLKEMGFEHVYQLDGGIINYGYKEGNQHWKGKLFVFDDRLSAPISDDEHELISHCHLCDTECDLYYNCANMDCNALFLSCGSCSEKLQGCCSEECIKAPRRRPFEKSERPKPFRKWYHYSKTKEMNSLNDTICSCSAPH
ncbi:MAG: hypothetical protein KR126chlam1_01230 [Chlamydiae bacterium]|nr:hypothetical protein [Chlamydiota bacterium]